MKAEEDREAKADQHFAAMGWPHSSGEDRLGPSRPPPALLTPPAGEGEGGGLGGGSSRRRRRRRAPPAAGEGGLLDDPDLGLDGLGLEDDDWEEGDEEEEEEGLGLGLGGGGLEGARRDGGGGFGGPLPGRDELDFWQLLDLFLSLAIDLRQRTDRWAERLRHARGRASAAGYAPQQQQQEEAPSIEDVDWG